MLVLVIFVGQPAFAGGVEKALDLLDAPVPYSASYRASDGKGEYLGKVWHQPGKERRDFETKGGGQSLVLRKDQDAAFLMKPAGKWYVSVSFHAAIALAGGFDSMTVTKQPTGVETINGQKANRSHLVAKAADGRQFVGDFWALSSGAPVKVEGVETEPNGKQTQVSLIQTDIVIGRVGNDRFDLPEGYMGINLKKIPPDKLVQAIEGIMPLLAGKK
jgi:hypothetical protein